ncbi:MAG: ATP-binding protein [Sandaracinus sp.]
MERPRPEILAPQRVIFRASAVTWAVACGLALVFATPFEAGAALLAAIVMVVADRLHPSRERSATQLAAVAGMLAAVTASWNTGGLTSPFLALILPALFAATQGSGRASQLWVLVGLTLALPLVVHDARPLGEKLALCTTSFAAISITIAWLLQHRRVLQGERTRADDRAERAERLTKKLEAARSAERAAAQNRANFYAVMSHELRTPLGGLVGLSAVLESSKLDPSQVEIVRNMRASAESLRLLVNDVLDLEALERGVLRLEPSAFSFRDLAKDVALLFRATAAAKGVTVVVDVADDLPLALEGDALRIRQVLSNLLSNAVKFTEKGSVELRVRWDESASRVTASVIDSGAGIPAGDVSRVFAPFEQTGPRREGGTGLGLSIVKHLVDRMGGRIRVESVVGKGSAFEVSLPLVVLEALPSDRPVAVREHPSFIGVRALVVDDDEINRFTTRLVLEHFGVLADVAASGDEALALLARDRFTIAFIDMNMPDLSGPELARAILSRPGHHPYLAALTASTNEADRERAQAAGMRGYLTKPLDTGRLEQVIREATGTKRSVLSAPTQPKLAPSASAVAPPPSKSTSGREILDSDKLAELLAMMPGQEGVTLVEDALAQVHQLVTSLKATVASGDRHQAKLHAHKLKGTCGTMGFAALHHAAANLEQLAEGSEPLGPAIGTLATAAETNERAARAYLRTRG